VLLPRNRVVLLYAHGSRKTRTRAAKRLRPNERCRKKKNEKTSSCIRQSFVIFARSLFTFYARAFCRLRRASSRAQLCAVIIAGHVANAVDVTPSNNSRALFYSPSLRQCHRVRTRAVRNVRLSSDTTYKSPTSSGSRFDSSSSRHHAAKRVHRRQIDETTPWPSDWRPSLIAEKTAAVLFGEQCHVNVQETVINTANK